MELVYKNLAFESFYIDFQQYLTCLISLQFILIDHTYALQLTDSASKLPFYTDKAHGQLQQVWRHETKADAEGLSSVHYEQPLGQTERPCMQKQKRSLQRLVAEGLKLVSVFLTELLGSLGCLWHVRLAGYSSLNHLLRKNKSSNQPCSQPPQHTNTKWEKKKHQTNSSHMKSWPVNTRCTVHVGA